MESIKGSVWAVIFSTDGYSVWEIKQGSKHTKVTLPLDYKDPVGLKFRFDGEWIEHPKYGKQFKASAVELLTSESPTETALKALLPEIGYHRAKKLVKKFGEDVWELIASDPLKLTCIEGITEERAMKIQKAYLSSQTAGIVKELFALGLDEFAVKKMVVAWKGEAIIKFNEDPYQLMEIRGIGFPKADYYAQKAAKISFYDERRVKAGLRHILIQNEHAGSTSMEASKWLTETAKLLGVEKGRVFNIAKELKETAEVSVIEYEGTQLTSRSSSFAIEIELAKLIKKLVEEKRLVIFTGPPGTGKTYRATKEIAKEIEVGSLVGACAPTGKAAQRFSELGSVPAQTIHRMLRVDATGEFYYNEQNPLPWDFIVVDETSMVDTELCHALMSAIDNEVRVLMVGDPWQLPSVGAGKVLYDVINAHPDIATKLTKVWRSTTSIPIHCQKIWAGEVPEFDQHLVFIKADSPEEVIEAVDKLKPDMVLSPRKRKHSFSCDELNEKLQARYQKSAEWVNKKFQVGDPVVQTMNDYRLQVFNGEVGTVMGKGENGTFRVMHHFPTREIEYPLNYPDIELAYVLSVHKSQGSEWDNIAIILHPSMGWMLRRDLIYTAVSRAKKRCFVIGSRKAFAKAVEINKPEVSRRTTLLPILFGEEKWEMITE
jgi:exodeoxyribonuclease V alpha subunit